MKRNIDLKDISDGRLYGLNDMVKAGCSDCKGCSSCCEGMGSSIILDPLDIHRLTTNLGVTFEQLLGESPGKIELNVVDGIILPNLKMAGEAECCAFLNQEGRCSIHSFRPGICRIFPLGRYYENNSFQYFLQIHECKNQNRVKIKVRNWVDTPDIRKYEQFVADWHYFLNDLEEIIAGLEQEELIKTINLYVLNHFYRKPYEENEDFYIQFQERFIEAKKRRREWKKKDLRC
ncbi:MAG: YkgJ family cysteine cluster protein [Lachnospiraceae bacterium]|nr:YkgJ family cysteine cluster protein [Lachnospiraceae bacterium]